MGGRQHTRAHKRIHRHTQALQGVKGRHVHFSPVDFKVFNPEDGPDRHTKLLFETVFIIIRQLGYFHWSAGQLQTNTHAHTHAGGLVPTGNLGSLKCLIP